jgi:hypothetical protein
VVNDDGKLKCVSAADMPNAEFAGACSEEALEQAELEANAKANYEAPSEQAEAERGLEEDGPTHGGEL